MLRRSVLGGLAAGTALRAPGVGAGCRLAEDGRGGQEGRPRGEPRSSTPPPSARLAEGRTSRPSRQKWVASRSSCRAARASVGARESALSEQSAGRFLGDLHRQRQHHHLADDERRQLLAARRLSPTSRTARRPTRPTRPQRPGRGHQPRRLMVNRNMVKTGRRARRVWKDILDPKAGGQDPVRRLSRRWAAALPSSS